MNLDPYIESIRRQLEVAAGAGEEDARALAGRLVAPLDAAVRLALQDALAAAAEEITLEIAPGSVELRLRGREPEFAVSLPPAEAAEVEEVPAGGWRAGDAGPAAADGEDAAVSRINLRLPDRLKSEVERAAAGEGLSVNAWLVRAAAAAVARAGSARSGGSRPPRSRQRYTGWAR